MSPFTNQPTAKAVATRQSRDTDFILVRYMHPNRGAHLVWGSSRDDSGQQRCYGSRVGGGQETFLVHRSDVFDPRTGQQVSFHFVPVPEGKVTPVVARPIQPTIEPTSILEAKSEPPSPTIQSTINPPVSILGAEASETPETPDVSDGRLFDLQTIPGVTHVVAASMVEHNITTREQIVELGIAGLQGLRGCGPVRAEMIIQYLTEPELEGVTE